MARVYLAWSSAGVATLHKHKEDRAINLLVSYAIWDQYLKTKDGINIKSMILDSGAFSVFNSGKTIDINHFIHIAKTSGAGEVFALDDMVSWQRSQMNTLKIWNAGIAAIPVYHMNEPIEYLDWCCKHSPCGKIALSSRIKTRPEWLAQMFGHIWKEHGPIKIHGFGMASSRALEAQPFDSVDASSWATAPGRFGQYAGFTGKQIHLKTKMRKGVDTDLWVECMEHFRREDMSEFRWRKELEIIRK
jgi:hypothetical protein